MPRSGPPVCAQCGVGLSGAFDAAAQCVSCRRTPLSFEMARAPWQYVGLVQEAIRQFKYHRRWRLGRWLAQEMAITARRSLPLDAVGAVVSVPLHWFKLRMKGFNPADHLASTIAHSLEIPYLPHMLRRTRWTTTQTRLSWHARFLNVRRAFVAHTPRGDDRGILLIDDVLTSGATTDACARALKDVGARTVFVLTAARTPLA